MVRIRLSKNEKRVFRNVAAQLEYWPGGMSEEEISHALCGLERVGLVKVMWASGMKPVAADLTGFGKAYLDFNPHLWNPLNWVKLGAIAAILSALIGGLALIIACTK